MRHLIIIFLFLLTFAINKASSQTRIFRGAALGLDFELMLNFTKTDTKEYSIKGHYFFHNNRTPMAVKGNLKNGILKIQREKNGRAREIFTAKQNNKGRWIGKVKFMNKNETKIFFVDELRGKASRGKNGSSHWAWNLATNEIIYPETICGYVDEYIYIQTMLNKTSIYDKVSNNAQYKDKPIKVNGKLFTGTIAGYDNYGESLIYSAKFDKGNLVGKIFNLNQQWDKQSRENTEDEGVAMEDQ